MKMRPIYQIPAEIKKTWVNKDGKSNVYFGAVPYLSAMFDLGDANDTYGCDSAKSIVVYFLANASTYRGETAKRIKTELKQMFKIK